MPDEAHEDEDPSNRAVLAAIPALRNEVTQIKNDISPTIDHRIKDVYMDLRGEIATAREELLTSISKLERTSATRSNSIKEMERSASVVDQTVLAHYNAR